MSERILFAGIDPGWSGAVTFMNASGTEVIRFGFGETKADIAIPFRSFAPKIRMAYIEKVASRPLQSSQSTFTFGTSFGFLLGLLVAFEIPHEEVKPIKWMSKMDCMTGGDKNVTKQRAQQLWPGLKWTHQLSDSALIAECCRRTYTRLNNSGSSGRHHGEPDPGSIASVNSNGEEISEATKALRAWGND